MVRTIQKRAPSVGDAGFDHPNVNHQMEVRGGFVGRAQKLCNELFYEIYRLRVSADRWRSCFSGEVREWLKRSASKADIP